MAHPFYEVFGIPFLGVSIYLVIVNDIFYRLLMDYFLNFNF
jgi:hypothetical protein